MTGKVVNVRLSENEHAVLKAYAASIDLPMQDVMREFVMIHLQQQHFCCRQVRYWFKQHNIPVDPRAVKPCFGYACFYCSHLDACKNGETDKLYIPQEEIRELVTEESQYIFDFDGSSIQPPS